MGRWAAVDSDGMDLAIWGVGTTEAAAERDATKQDGFERTEHFRLVQITPAEYNKIRIHGGGRWPAVTSRRGPGRPVTTGSDGTPRITFVAPSRAAYDALKASADEAGVSVGQLAKRRTFPIRGDMTAA